MYEIRHRPMLADHESPVITCSSQLPSQSFVVGMALKTTVDATTSSNDGEDGDVDATTRRDDESRVGLGGGKQLPLFFFFFLVLFFFFFACSYCTYWHTF